jgi:hypothetical protein
VTLPPEVFRWPLPAAEAYAERLAIMVVDGGIPEDEARRLAEARVRVEWGREEVATMAKKAEGVLTS